MLLDAGANKNAKNEVRTAFVAECLYICYEHVWVCLYVDAYVIFVFVCANALLSAYSIYVCLFSSNWSWYRSLSDTCLCLADFIRRADGLHCIAPLGVAVRTACGC